MITEADRINAALTDEARDGLRTIISLDGFLALKGEARAARWRQMDRAGKWQLVVQQIERLGYDWMPSDVELHIAKYDERYAAGPLDAAIEGALERLACDHRAHARAAAAGDAPKDATFFRRAATAYTNALDQYTKGVRPQLLTSGAYLLPSSSGQPAHIVHMDGDWVCSCKAGASMHWPIALIIGLEVAHDAMQTFDDGDVEDVAIIDDAAPAQLGRRLAEARSRLYSEAA